MRYEVHVSGHNWTVVAIHPADTITACRRIAESYGTMADYGVIYKGRRVVGEHRRSPEGSGTGWYKAVPQRGEQ